jgi:ABC-type nitrate/sulfonate/bicarbonate transport system permease component
MHNSKRFAGHALFWVAFLGGWEIIQRLITTQRLAQGQTGLDAFFPTPSTIMFTFVQDWQYISTALLVTVGRGLIGCGIGALLALSVAALLDYIPRLRGFIMPTMFAVNAFPIIGFAPLIILMFGQGSILSIIFVATLISYFPILITLDHAIRHTSRDLLASLEVAGATRRQLLWHVKIPLAQPNLFVALRLALPASIIGAMIGEWLGARSGIGNLITIGLYQLKPGLLYGALFALTTISAMLTWALHALERACLPWKFYVNDRPD